jgi:hypothetical protein
MYGLIGSRAWEASIDTFATAGPETGAPGPAAGTQTATATVRPATIPRQEREVRC